jgi:microcystin-dependent protein
MAYLGRQASKAALNSSDIPDNSITTAKIVDDNVTAAKIPAGAVSSDVLYLENNTSTQDLSGTYSTERLYFNDSYQLTGNVTVTGHLSLGTIADEDVVITNDSSARTIDGSGTLESGDLLDQDRPDLTGMTGELGSTVIGASGFTGMIAPFAMTTVPNGWLVCDGSSILRAGTYANLFDAIGETWGSADGTHFNVPDLRGAFLRGTGGHGSSNMADGNDFAGPAVGTFENDQFQKHEHTLRADSGGSGYWVLAYNNADRNSVSNELDQIHSGNGYAEHDSGGTPRVGDETRPFNAGINYCIKY